MIDILFQDALYYFLTLNDVVLLAVGSVSVFVFIVSLLTILKKWGDSY